MSKTIEILADLRAIVERAKELVVAQIKQSCDERGIFTMALSGGSTPKPLYEAIATLDLDWNKIHIFWGDERYVNNDHPDSNERMARLAWLDKVDIPPANIHPMNTTSNDPFLAASWYEEHILNFFNVPAGTKPQFDLILLGMGDDGHTASLFPNTQALQITDKLITVGYKGEQPRLTFTYPLINHSRCVIFMVAGSNKRSALDQIMAETGDNLMYPSRLINPVGQLYWLLDQAAYG